MTPVRGIMAEEQSGARVTPYFVEMKGRRFMVVEELTNLDTHGAVDRREAYFLNDFATGHQS